MICYLSEVEWQVPALKLTDRFELEPIGEVDVDLTCKIQTDNFFLIPQKEFTTG